MPSLYTVDGSWMTEASINSKADAAILGTSNVLTQDLRKSNWINYKAVNRDDFINGAGLRSAGGYNGGYKEVVTATKRINYGGAWAQSIAKAWVDSTGFSFQAGEGNELAIEAGLSLENRVDLTAAASSGLPGAGDVEDARCRAQGAASSSFQWLSNYNSWPAFSNLCYFDFRLTLDLEDLRQDANSILALDDQVRFHANVRQDAWGLVEDSVGYVKVHGYYNGAEEYKIREDHLSIPSGTALTQTKTETDVGFSSFPHVITIPNVPFWSFKNGGTVAANVAVSTSPSVVGLMGLETANSITGSASTETAEEKIILTAKLEVTAIESTI